MAHFSCTMRIKGGSLLGREGSALAVSGIRAPRGSESSTDDTKSISSARL